MMNTMKRIALTLLATCALALPATASAARTANVDDPQDAQPTVSGTPDTPDVQHISVSDDGQTITFTTSFYNALNGLDTSYKYDHYIIFTIGYATSGYCSGAQNGAVSGAIDIVGGHVADQGSVYGYSGTLPISRTTAADQRSVTATMTSPAFQGQNYSCVEATEWARYHDSASSLYSRYDTSCDCWYSTIHEDNIGSDGGQYTPFFYFDDSHPAPPPPTPTPVQQPPTSAPTPAPMSESPTPSSGSTFHIKKCSDLTQGEFQGEFNIHAVYVSCSVAHKVIRRFETSRQVKCGLHACSGHALAYRCKVRFQRNNKARGSCTSGRKRVTWMQE